MSRHFCCCIPVRVAVFITSFLGFLFSILITAAAVFLLIKTKDEDNPALANLTSDQKTGLIVVAVIYALVALVSLFGFIGSVIRRRGFVALYSTMLIIALLLQTAVDIYSLINLFRNDSQVHCTTDPNVDPGVCQDALRVGRWVLLAILVVFWLIQLYLTIVVRRYVKQLEDEQSYNRASNSVNSAFNMAPTGKTAYYPHQPLDQDQSLLAPQGEYAYSDPHHSFGAHA